MSEIVDLVCAILGNQLLLQPHLIVTRGTLSLDGSEQITARVNMETVYKEAFSMMRGISARQSLEQWITLTTNSDGFMTRDEAEQTIKTVK